MIAEYISANQFRVEEDRTGEFKTGRRIKANCDVDGYIYSTILSSSYSSPYTTVTIVENVLTSNLIDVLYGIVNIGETGAFPDHLHDGAEGQGGALPYVTTTDFNTYSGILQTQINNKPDTFLELIDTPSLYDYGKYARSTSSGIVWATAGSSNVQSFLDLTDVPNTFSGTTGKFAQSTGSGIVWTRVDYTPSLSNDLSYSGSSFSSTAGENLLFGDVCYLKNDGKFWKARANSEATSKGLLSLSTGSINTNSQGTFLQVGYIRNNSWNFTIGSELFIPTTSGSPTGIAPSTPGSIVRIVGNAYATNIIWFCPDQTYIELSSTTSSGVLFTNLADVPSTYSGTKGLFAQSTGSGIIWAVASGSGSSNVQSFLDLTDTPNEYSIGKFAQSTASGIVWTTASGSGTQTFIELTDTPSSYAGQDGKYVKVVGNTLEFATVSGLGGTYDSSWLFELDENGGLMPSTGSGILNIQSFLDLTDVPHTYSGTIGKFAQSTGSGIVWATVSGGGGTGISYGELELTYSSNIVLDFTTYNLQSVILTGNTNFTFTNMTNGKPCVLNVIQDAQGSRSATFQSDIRWPQGVIPTTSSGSGLYDIFTFIQSRGTICGSCSAAFQLGS